MLTITIDAAVPAAALVTDGGFTFDPRTESFVRRGNGDGYVIPIPDTERPIRPDFVPDDFADALTDAFASVDSDKYGDDVLILGRVSDDGRYVIRLANVFRVPLWMAEIIGRDRSQSVMFDLATGKAIPLRAVY